MNSIKVIYKLFTKYKRIEKISNKDYCLKNIYFNLNLTKIYDKLVLINEEGKSRYHSFHRDFLVGEKEKMKVFEHGSGVKIG